MVQSPDLFRRTLLISALVALATTSGCFTALGALGGHVGEREQQAMKDKCAADKVPRAYCPVPQDHTIAGAVLGLAVDYGLFVLLMSDATATDGANWGLRQPLARP